ncbi:MAG: Lrp/AsnC family transcriptional regulator [Lachnospiraceae bacterium]|nr:Lrp/AsnC family transcriptional regulator [Lachnospiraceae bacterium]
MREEILKILDRNSRVSAADIASMLGVNEDLVQFEIAKMEAEQVICGYPTLINWEKTDSEKVTALIEVKVTPQRGQGFDRIAKRIYQYEEVDAVYLMSGGFDLTVIIEGKNIREVAQFVSDKLAPMEAVISTATHFVLKKYKEHGMPLAVAREDGRMLITP